ncbi:glutamine synthetase [Brachionus plicatilis]|uniref:Glutamine synthetase n=1 Tax=Brachionus plicatilis TaxID=10195 RepID=A0A3M7RFJ2_BRAPC|nr:glutamine synthetase [Brachionus plicatilis]
MALNKQTSNRFDLLAQPRSFVLATYIWLDTDCHQVLRTKSRTLDFEPQSIDDVPEWDCAIAFATSYINTDFYIRPIRMFKDPFFSSNCSNKLVLCQNYKHDKTIADENKRVKCKETFDKLAKYNNKAKPTFIVEQIYALYENTGFQKIDMHLDKKSAKLPKWFHYCSIGIDHVTGRNVAECHYKACLYAGINIKSVNSEKNLSEWKFEIGPCEAFDLADQLIVARYILHRIAEDFNVVVKFESEAPNIISKLYFSIEQNDFILKNVNSIREALSKMDLKMGNCVLLLNKRINNGLSGILKLIHEQNKVELGEILERDMHLKNGQKSHFVNQLFSSSKLSSNFSCFFEIQIAQGSNCFDPYLLLDHLITIILSLLDPDV